MVAILKRKIDFIHIGPGKCGTTWLYNVLRHHPQVGLSNAKETFYFDRYFEQGEASYHHFFPAEASSKCVGEISNTYFFDAKVPQRIALYRPDIKIISTLRNPIERTFSHYLFMLRTGHERGTFDEVLARRPDLIERGRYTSFIDRFDQYFAPEQLLLNLFEDLKNDVSSFARGVFDFLEVDDLVSESVLKERTLVAGKARNEYVALAVRKMADWTRDAGFARIVNRLKFNKSVTGLLFANFKPGEKPKLTDEQRERLRNLFFEDVEKLSDRLDRDMVEYWNFGG